MSHGKLFGRVKILRKRRILPVHYYTQYVISRNVIKMKLFVRKQLREPDSVHFIRFIIKIVFKSEMNSVYACSIDYSTTIRMESHLILS